MFESNEMLNFFYQQPKLFGEIVKAGNIPKEEYDDLRSSLGTWLVFYDSEVKYKKNRLAPHCTNDFALQEIVSMQKNLAHVLEDISPDSRWFPFICSTKFNKKDYYKRYPEKTPAFIKYDKDYIFSDEEMEDVNVNQRILVLSLELRWLSEVLDVMKQEFATGEISLGKPIGSASKPYNIYLAETIVHYWSDVLGREIKDISKEYTLEKKPLTLFAAKIFEIFSKRYGVVTKRHKKIIKNKPERLGMGINEPSDQALELLLRVANKEFQSL